MKSFATISVVILTLLAVAVSATVFTVGFDPNKASVETKNQVIWERTPIEPPFLGEVTLTATGGVPTGTFSTLKEAFDAVNAGLHQGDIVININANTTEGTTPATLNSSGAGLASYTSILIRPTVDGVSITGNPATGLGVIIFNGADNVTLDGDNPNTSGTTRNLTIANTAAASVVANSVVRIATSSTAPFDSNSNITIKNTILSGNVTGGNSSTITSSGTSSNSSFGIIAGPNGGSSVTAITSVTGSMAAGVTVSNLNIDNNAVSQCARGIVFLGNTSASSTGVTITNNTIGASGSPSPSTPPYTSPATTVYTKGIFVQGTNALTISGNTIQNIISSVATTMNGIEIVSGIGSGTMAIQNNSISTVAQNTSANIPRGILISNAGAPYSVAGNTVSNVRMAVNAVTTGIEIATSGGAATVERNIIRDVLSDFPNGNGAYGINLATGSNHIVRNNFVINVRNNQTTGGTFSTTFGAFGIRVGAGSGHKVLHNSVNLFGTMPGSMNQNLTAAFGIVGTSSTGLDVRNNIFANQMTGGNPAGTRHAAIYLPSGGTSMNLTLNNNDYFRGSDPNDRLAQVGQIFGTGEYLAADFNPGSTTPAANFRSYSSTVSGTGTNDDSSKSIDPIFVSDTDLHIQLSSTMESSGANASVVTDIDGDSRGTTPDIGADEITISTPGTIQFSSPTYSITEAGPTVTITATRTGGSSGAVGASYSLGGGTATGGAACGALPNTTDYVNAGGTVSFANGDTTPQTISVPICSDIIFEGSETFAATLASPTGGATIGSPNAATVTLTDDDAAPTISITDVTMAEGDSGTTGFVFTVSRTGSPSQAQINIAYHTADGSATAPGDYTSVPSGTAIISALGASTTITIQVNGDTSVEPDETFSVILDNTSVGTISDGTGVGTITNDEATMQFSSAAFSGPEGTTAVITVSRTGSTSGTSTVQYQASGGTGTGGACSTLGVDYGTVTGTLTFDPADTAKTFGVTLCNDFYSENPAETAGLSISSPTGGTLGGQSSATLNILDAASQYANSSAVAVTNGSPGSVYPATINVSGYPSSIAGMRVTLFGVTLSNPDDLDVLLVGPGGQTFVLMSDTGGATALNNATVTLEDTASVFLPDSSAITDGQNYKPATCGTAAFPAPAPAGPYNDPGCGSGTNPTLASTFGGTNPNGNWNLYVSDDGGAFSPLASGQIGGGWSMQFLAPTAANVSLSGRILTANGAGIRNALVRLTGINGLVAQPVVQTGPFGYYRFTGVEAGQTYIITVTTKRYRLAQPTRVVSVVDDLFDVDFVAEPRE